MRRYIWILFFSWLNSSLAFLACSNREICLGLSESWITNILRRNSFLKSKTGNSVESLWIPEGDDEEDTLFTDHKESLDKNPNQSLKHHRRKRRRTVGVGRLGYNVTTLHRAKFDLPTYFDLNDQVTYSIRMNLLNDYLKQYGDLNVPFRYIVHNVVDYDLNGVVIGTYKISLGKWLTTLRRKFQSDPSNIPAKYKEQLDHLGMNWVGVGSGRRPSSFRKRCDELKNFVDTYGHDMVPVFGPTKSLGMWVDRMRLESRRVRNGKSSSSLTLDRIHMLQDAGMNLDRNDTIQKLHEKFDKQWYSDLELWKKYRKMSRPNQEDTISNLVEADIFLWYLEQQIAYELFHRRMKLSNKPLQTPLTPQRLDILTREGVDHRDSSLLVPIEGFDSITFEFDRMIDTMASYKEKFGISEISLDISKSLSAQKENLELLHFQQRLRWEKRHFHLISNITGINWLHLDKDGFDRINLLNSIGFSWDVEQLDDPFTSALQSEIEWWDMFHDLGRYKNLNGDFNLEPHRPWYSQDLHDWLDEQNVAYESLISDNMASNMTKMTELRYICLCSIGYNFQYHIKRGPLATTRRKSSVLRLDSDMKNESQILPDDLIQSLSLSKLNDGIDKTEQLAWLVRYETLRRIGPANLLDSISVDDNIKQRLILWVRNQQKQYQNYIHGKKSTLTARRIEMLQEINFEFNYESKITAEKDNWDEMISALSEFKREYGHCFVPLIYSKNTKLAEWVHFQRQICMTGFHMEDTGLSETITKKKKQELIDLGLDITRDNSSFCQIAFDVVSQLYLSFSETRSPMTPSNIQSIHFKGMERKIIGTKRFQKNIRAL